MSGSPVTQGWRQAVQDGPDLRGKFNAPGCEAALEKYGSYGEAIDAVVIEELNLSVIDDPARHDARYLNF